jgi:hypothetical protein
MNKDHRWKQPTPIMQLRAILGSLEGHQSNQEDGIIADSAYIVRAQEHTNQLLNLLPFFEQGHW